MAIAFRAASTDREAVTATTDVTVTAPSGLTNGDLVIVVIATDGTHVISTAPSGWTAIVEGQTTDGSDSSVSAYYKIASSEGASWTWSGLFVSDEYWAYGCVAYSGVDGTTPMDVSPVIDTPSSTNVPTAGPITPTTNGAMIVAAFGADFNSDVIGAPDSSPSATERVDFIPTNRGGVYIEEYAQATAAEVTLGATFTRYGSADNDEYVSIALALRPASAGGTTLTVMAHHYAMMRQRAATWF